MLNSFVCYCGVTVFVIVFNKIFKKLQMTHAEKDKMEKPILLLADISNELLSTVLLS